MPFSNSTNPLMLMVAFLASSVNPAIAAAAAQAALSTLTNPSTNNNGGSGEALHKNEGGKGDYQNAQQDLDEGKDDHGNTQLSKQGLQAAAATALSAAVLKAKVS